MPNGKSPKPPKGRPDAPQVRTRRFDRAQDAVAKPPYFLLRKDRPGER
jgi:hypothetical protein